jgi:hypothetical protein
MAAVESRMREIKSVSCPSCSIQGAVRNPLRKDPRRLQTVGETVRRSLAVGGVSQAGFHFIPGDAVVGFLAMIGSAAFRFRSLFGGEYPEFWLIHRATR